MSKKLISEIEHVWSVLSAKSIIDARTNSVSLFDLIEKITLTVGGQPSSRLGSEVKKIPADMVLTSRIRRKEERKSKLTIQLRYTIVDGSGKKVEQYERLVEFKEGITNMRVRMEMKHFPITQAGSYFVNIGARLNGESQYTPIARVPVEVAIEEAGE